MTLVVTMTGVITRDPAKADVPAQDPNPDLQQDREDGLDRGPGQDPPGEKAAVKEMTTIVVRMIETTDIVIIVKPEDWH